MSARSSVAVKVSVFSRDMNFGTLGSDKVFYRRETLVSGRLEKDMGAKLGIFKVGGCISLCL